MVWILEEPVFIKKGGDIVNPEIDLGTTNNEIAAVEQRAYFPETWLWDLVGR